MFYAFNSARLPLVIVAAATLAPASDWVPLNQRIINESVQTQSFTLRDGGTPTQMVIGVSIQTDSAGGDRTIEPVDAKSKVTVKPGETIQLFLTRPGPRTGGCLVFDFKDDSGASEWGFELHVDPDFAKVWFQYRSLPDDKAGNGKVSLNANRILFHREDATGEDRAASDADLQSNLYALLSRFSHGQPSSLPTGGVAQGQAPSSAPGSGHHSQLPSPGSGSPGQSLPSSPLTPAGSDRDDSLPPGLAERLVAFSLDHGASSPRFGASLSPFPSSAPGSAYQSQLPSPDPGNASPGQFPSPDAGNSGQSLPPAPPSLGGVLPPEAKNSGT
jgi:hypothetical protein